MRQETDSKGRMAGTRQQTKFVEQKVLAKRLYLVLACLNSYFSTKIWSPLARDRSDVSFSF